MTTTKYNLRKDYYDCGFGVNEAEALRQEMITDVALLWMHTPEAPEDTEGFREFCNKLERLADLAGAKAYMSPKKNKNGNKKDDNEKNCQTCRYEHFIFMDDPCRCGRCCRYCRRVKRSDLWAPKEEQNAHTVRTMRPK